MSSKCGNPECNCSSTIAEQVSFGAGRLDPNGFWEFPCWTCAKEFQHTYPHYYVWPQSQAHADDLAAQNSSTYFDAQDARDAEFDHLFPRR
jgi:hypothetical protein